MEKDSGAAEWTADGEHRVDRGQGEVRDARQQESNLLPLISLLQLPKQRQERQIEDTHTLMDIFLCQNEITICKCFFSGLQLYRVCGIIIKR